LDGEAVISYRGDSLPGMLVDHAFAGEGRRLRADVEIDVSIIALSFVQQSIGIALVDGLLPWASFPRLIVPRFPPPLALPRCLVTSSERPLSRHQETLRQELRMAVRNYAADPASQGVLAAV